VDFLFSLRHYINNNNNNNNNKKSTTTTTMGVPKIVFDTLSEFCQHTTIGGLCNAGLAPSRIRRVIWLIIFAILVNISTKNSI
jgi:hypothetical protein